MVLLNGPVPECLRLVHSKELPVPKGWNSLLPTWERLLLQGTAGSQRLERMGPNLGTSGYRCKQLPVLMVPNVGTKGYHGKELPVPRP